MKRRDTGGIVGQYQPTPGVSRRNDHNEVAPQNHSGMPLPETDGAIGEAHSGTVCEAGRVEEGSGEGRDGGVVDTPLEK